MQLSFFTDQPPKHKPSKAAMHYEEFVKKFEVKKTTDDCYTPAVVYDAVLSYVRNAYDIDGAEIVRPFFPGKDYRANQYPDGCVVVDNPPFSILTEIVRYYHAYGIRYFLFAPHLTLFSVARELPVTYIVADASIKYENGAVVNTSFVTNLRKTPVIRTATDLKKAIKTAQLDLDAKKLVYEYPPEVLTVSRLAWIGKRGVDVCIERDNTHAISGLASQKQSGKGIFGTGFLISKSAMAKLEAAEREAAEREAAEREAAEREAAERTEVVVWKLSETEKTIVSNL